MSERIPPSEQTRQRIRDLLANGGVGDIKSRSLTLSVRQMVEELLEAEVSDVLGREFYERRAEDPAEEGEPARVGYCNGYRTGRLKATEGQIEHAVPQVRDLSNQSFAISWMADTRDNVHRAFDHFVETFEAKYPSHRVHGKRPRRGGDLLQLPRRTLEASADDQPDRIVLEFYQASVD